MKKLIINLILVIIFLPLSAQHNELPGNLIATELTDMTQKNIYINKYGKMTLGIIEFIFGGAAETHEYFGVRDIYGGGMIKSFPLFRTNYLAYPEASYYPD